MFDNFNTYTKAEAAAVSDTLAKLAEHLEFLRYADIDIDLEKLIDIIGDISNLAAFRVDDILKQEERELTKVKLNSLYGVMEGGAL